MSSEGHVRLLDLDHDLARGLSAEERAVAERLTLPVRRLRRGELDFEAWMQAGDAFAALILDGLILHRLVVSAHEATRVLGPGDIVSRSGSARSQILADVVYHVGAETRVAMLDDELLTTARRWPRLVSGLHARMGDQAERVAIQMAICQLPRVSDRVLMMLWLLAESWGRVTTAGVTVPLTLTHELIGSLVGARRSTVTLALSELTERGAIVRQDRGWLLLESPAIPTAPDVPAEAPVFLGNGPSAWSAPPTPLPPPPEFAHDEMLAHIARLRARHLENTERVREQLKEVRATRDEILRRRETLRTGRRFTPR